MQIEIRDQNPLGFGKTIEVCVSGIYHRFFRSFITVMVIALAVAFVVMILGDALLRGSVRSHILEKTRRDGLFERWVGWLSRPVTESELTAIFASDREDSRQTELLTWAELGEPIRQTLKAVTREEAFLASFLEGLPAGRRRALIGKLPPQAALREMMTEEGERRFEENLFSLKSIQIPGGMERVRAFLEKKREIEPLRERMRRGHAQVIHKAVETLSGTGVREALLNPPQGFAENLRGLGFHVSEGLLRELEGLGRKSLEEDALAEALRGVDVRRIIAKRLNRSFIEVTPEASAAYVGTKQGAAWLLKTVEGHQGDFGLAETEIREVARRILERNRRQRAKEQLGKADSGFWGLGARAGWLLLVSLVVCTVGISNAMLMSVAERFREIATMKCLGAIDGTIAVLFVIESCVLGLAGGAIGAGLGIVLGIIRGFLFFGSLVFFSIPYTNFGLVGLGAVAYGILLAGVAAVYPALVAARLAPMEAMRVE